MNRIYKVIWNKVRNCYVVTSELAKSRTKDATQPTERRKSANLLAVVALILGVGIFSFPLSPTVYADEISASTPADANPIVGSVYKGVTSAGEKNDAVSEGSTVTGGWKNTAGGTGWSDTYASVSGGASNKATARAASVSGGENNTAGFNYASVTGGEDNTAGSEWGGSHSSISGGRGNTTEGYDSSISGGRNNSISSLGMYASIAGGEENTAKGDAAVVGGGYKNTASGGNSFVAGGTENTAYGVNTTAIGGTGSEVRGAASVGIGGGSTKRQARNAVAIGNGSMATEENQLSFGDASDVTKNHRLTNIADGINEHDAASLGQINTALEAKANAADVYSKTEVDDAIAGASPIVGSVDKKTSRGKVNTAASSGSTVTGGRRNTAGGSDFLNETHASVSGGQDNRATGQAASISGGQSNKADALSASVSGGESNIAHGGSSSVSGGRSNTANAYNSSISGGEKNTISTVGQFGTITGGRENQVNAKWATVAGGWKNKATGIDAFTAGGENNEASAARATAIGGQGAKVEGSDSTGIGGGSTTRRASNAVAIGYNSVATKENEISFGDANDAAKNHKLTNIADGTADTDAASVGQVKAALAKTSSLTRGENHYGDMETTLTEAASSSEMEEGKTNDFQSQVGVSGRNTSIETSETITDTSTGKKVTHESYGTYGSDIIYQGTQTWDESKNKGTMSSMQIIGSGAIFDLNQYGGEGGQLVSSTSTRIAGDKITVSDDKGNASRLSTDGLTVGGRNYDAAQAALMADGRIKGAGGKFEVGTDGSLRAAGGNFMVDTSGKASAKGVDAGGEKVTNVATGDISAQSTDAVNGGQLYSMNNGLRSSIYKLDSRINKVGAGAAALAALHPQDFDPADKWNFAVGYGNYRDANAMALGAFYRPNASTMLSVGGSMGNGENMMNVGFSFKFGQSSPYAGMSRQSLIQALSAQRKDMEELKAQNISQSQQITELKKQNEEMQQQIAEILAKLK